MAGLLGGLFDFNKDGKMNTFERTMEFTTVSSMMDKKKKEQVNEFGNVLEDELDDVSIDELEMAGLDPDDLELMEEDERREALEEAGLDPDDFEDEF